MPQFFWGYVPKFLFKADVGVNYEDFRKLDILSFNVCCGLFPNNGPGKVFFLLGQTS